MLFCEWFFRYLLLNFLDELLYFTIVLNSDILVRVRIRKYGYGKKFDGYGTDTGEFWKSEYGYMTGTEKNKK